MILCYCGKPVAKGSTFCEDHAYAERAATRWTTCPTRVPADPPTVTISAGESVAQAIGRRCDAIKDLLIAKNRAYGNSATDPVRIFSRASADEQLRVRIDDKLSRLAKGQADAFGEDVVLDLIGYLVLLLVFRDMQADRTPALI